MLDFLRKEQVAVWRALENPRFRHVLSLAPTGSGKGYVLEQWIARHPDERWVLISPLVALQRQQVDRFARAGVEAQIGPKSTARVTVLSPEHLANVPGERVWDRAAVDECHTVWEWGRTFRPSLLRVPAWVHRHARRSLWMSATFPNRWIPQLEKQLPGPWFRAGEAGLSTSVNVTLLPTASEHKRECMRWYLKRRSDAGVIFSGTRENAERLARELSFHGRKARAYHAGLSREERMAIEAEIPSWKTEILVATSAFGMGMDHPSLRWAIVQDVPSSVAAAAQMMGRVGRGLGGGEALVLWNEDDLRRLWVLARDEEERQQVRELRSLLQTKSDPRRRIRQLLGASAF